MKEEDDAHLDALVEAEVDALRLEYKKTIPDKVREIERAFNENDIVSLAALAHKARGSAGSYGFADLSKIFAEMEDAAIALQSGDETQQKKITAALERLRHL